MGLTQASGFSVPRLCTLLKEWAGPFPLSSPTNSRNQPSQHTAEAGSGLLGAAASSQDVLVICRRACLSSLVFVCLLVVACHSWRDLEAAGNGWEDQHRFRTIKRTLAENHLEVPFPWVLLWDRTSRVLLLILHPFPLRAAKCSEREKDDKDTTQGVTVS